MQIWKGIVEVLSPLNAFIPTSAMINVSQHIKKKKKDFCQIWGKIKTKKSEQNLHPSCMHPLLSVCWYLCAPSRCLTPITLASPDLMSITRRALPLHVLTLKSLSHPQLISASSLWYAQVTTLKTSWSTFQKWFKVQTLGAHPCWGMHVPHARLHPWGQEQNRT